MTVYTVDRDAKFDVIGILVSLGMLRLRAGTYRCDIMSATLRGVAAKVRLSAAHSEHDQERPNDFGRNEVVSILNCRHGCCSAAKPTNESQRFDLTSCGLM